jgi:hypothetical protein
MYVITQKANLTGLTQGYRRKATTITESNLSSTVTDCGRVSSNHDSAGDEVGIAAGKLLPLTLQLLSHRWPRGYGVTVLTALTLRRRDIPS